MTITTLSDLQGHTNMANLTRAKTELVTAIDTHKGRSVRMTVVGEEHKVPGIRFESRDEYLTVSFHNVLAHFGLTIQTAFVTEKGTLAVLVVDADDAATLRAAQNGDL